jgi:glycerol-3-phosphate dehydrogenase
MSGTARLCGAARRGGGRSLAAEILAGSPTGLLRTSRDREARRCAAAALASPTTAVFTTSDVAGAETAAAFKNVVAVAIGLAEGLSDRLTESGLVATFANARAAVFARGMLDIQALVEAQGGRAATVLGLAGAGDLYVTCQHGRNGRFGRLLGSGATVEGAIRSIGSPVEGVANTAPALRIAARARLDLPSARAVDLALKEDLTGERVSGRLRDLFLTVVSGSRPPGRPGVAGCLQGATACHRSIVRCDRPSRFAEVNGPSTVRAAGAGGVVDSVHPA